MSEAGPVGERQAPKPHTLNRHRVRGDVREGDSPQTDQPAHVFDERGAARYTGVSQAALRLWRSKGEGPPYFKAGQKLVRYRRSDLDRWIESRIEKPADSGMSSAALGEQRRPR